MKNKMSKKRITIASILGCVLTLQLGAFSVTLETLASGITELPFRTFVLTMQPIHLAIGLVEGLITAVVLCFVYEARPEMLWGQAESVSENDGKFSFKKTLGILAVAAVVIGGILSLFASAFPDGLEWSMSKITGSTELEAHGKIYEFFAGIQDKTAFLPDYALKGSDSAVGTSISGIVGAVIVVAFCVGCCYLFRFFKRKKVVNE